MPELSPKSTDFVNQENHLKVALPKDINGFISQESTSPDGVLLFDDPNLHEDNNLLKYPEIQKDDPTTESLSSFNKYRVQPQLAASGNEDKWQPIGDLSVLFSDSTIAKIWAVAVKALNMSDPPQLYPEYTDGCNEYVYKREKEFWTSGFFPASLYLLLLRSSNHPLCFKVPQFPHKSQLEYACKWWTLNLHQNAHLKNTHDLGFMVLWARHAWDYNRDLNALKTLIVASKNLASRFDPTVGCLRSWDTCVTKIYSYTDPCEDFLVIIDNMLNLELLFWAADQLNDQELYQIAVKHAETTKKNNLRPDFSTYHVVNYKQSDGSVKAKFTNQGHSSTSCWSRGQAWAIAGFAQTYHWTRDTIFLDTARGCADYFLSRLSSSGIPPWDFLAPQEVESPTDTSASVIAIYGLLLIHEALTKLKLESTYLESALYMLRSLCSSQYIGSPAHFETSKISVSSVEHGEREESGPLRVELNGAPETILLGATINNFEHAPRRWANHGLVYADYYFLLVGNKLLDMGLIII